VGRNRWRAFTITYDRIIKDVKGNSITGDAPIFTAIETRWGGGDIVKYNDKRIEQVGVENLRGVSEYDPTVRTKNYGNMDRDKSDSKYQYQGDEYFSDENHYANFINLTNAKNGWIRNMTALHFVSSVVLNN
jgi:YHS domain-containing protein